MIFIQSLEDKKPDIEMHFASEQVLASVCPQSSESGLESSLARLAKFKKAEFTGVIEHFLNKRNAARGLYRQTLAKDRNKKKKRKHGKICSGEYCLTK